MACKKRVRNRNRHKFELLVHLHLQQKAILERKYAQ